MKACWCLNCSEDWEGCGSGVWIMLENGHNNARYFASEGIAVAGANLDPAQSTHSLRAQGPRQQLFQDKQQEVSSLSGNAWRISRSILALRKAREIGHGVLPYMILGGLRGEILRIILSTHRMVTVGQLRVVNIGTSHWPLSTNKRLEDTELISELPMFQTTMTWVCTRLPDSSGESPRTSLWRPSTWRTMRKPYDEPTWLETMHIQIFMRRMLAHSRESRGRQSRVRVLHRPYARRGSLIARSRRQVCRIRHWHRLRWIDRSLRSPKIR